MSMLLAAVSAFAIDDPLPFTQARIVEIDGERTWKLKVIDGYSTEGLVKTNGRIQIYGKDSLELVNPF